MVTPNKLAEMFGKGVKTIAPSVAVCIIGYMIGAMFADLNVSEEMQVFIEGVNFSKFGLVMFICLLTCFLGMVIPGSSLVVIFGPVFITTLASVGVNPILAAAMLPCICGVMCGITPPLGLGMYAGMSLAELYDSVKDYNLMSFGLNCSFGANELYPFIKEIAEKAECAISIYPNAGLPTAHGYNEKPCDTANAITAMANDGLINLAGGCCGTTPDHIREIKHHLEKIAPRKY